MGRLNIEGKSVITSKWGKYLFLIIAGIIYSIIFFHGEGIPHYQSEDAYFHINRLISMENVWTSPVSYHAFNGNGNLVNNFYPWLTMYPMYIVYKICGSYLIAYKIYYLLLNILTLLIANYAMKRITNSDISAICFAIIYTFSAYRFADVFRRSSLGECIAMAFFPLVLLGIYKVFFDNYKEWISFSVGMALIAYSHLISIFVMTLIIGFVFSISIFWWDSKLERIKALIKVSLVSGVLSLGAVVPIIQSFYKDIFKPEGNGKLLSESAFKLSDNINNSINNSNTAHGIGFLVLLALIVGVIFLVGLRNEKERSLLCITHSNYYTMMVFVITGVIVFLGTSSLLPWWHIGEYTPISNIQYVWRLNAYSTLFITAGFAWMLPYYLKTKQSAVVIMIVIIVTAFGLNFTAAVNLTNEEDHRIIETEFVSGGTQNHVPYFDYASKAAFDHFHEKGNAMGEYFYDAERITPKHDVFNKGSKLKICVDNINKNGTLDIPVFWYKSIKVTINGKKIETKMSSRGTVLVQLKKCEKAIIIVKHSYTLLIRLSWGISIIALIIVCILYTHGQFKHRREGEKDSIDGKKNIFNSAML